jgi:prepilin-type N-terminal cleavage/methylation domain-containing protein
MHFNNKNSQSGFTLIELLIVISIIGVLSGLAIVNFSGAQRSARDTERKKELEAVKTALVDWKLDNPTSGYPNHNQYDFNEIIIMLNNIGYLQERSITDPLTGTAGYVYRYFQTNNGDGFRLVACAENINDKAAIAQNLSNQFGCPRDRYFEVRNP